MVGGIPGGIRLRVDELDEKGRSLDAIVVADPGLRCTGPREMDLIGSGLHDLFPASLPDLVRYVFQIGPYQAAQYELLLAIHLRDSQADRRIGRRLSFSGGSDFPGGLFRDQCRARCSSLSD